MSGKYLWILLAVLLVVPAVVEAQVSPDTRLLQRPEWDGAVFTGLYLDGQFRYQKWDKAEAWMIGPTFAMSFAEMPQLETGARVFILNSNPDSASTETGFSDIDVWGKYQFLDDPILLSAGLLFTLPTGSEKVLHPKATGELNLELFGASRYYVTDMVAVIGHIGLRINSDMDYNIKGEKERYGGKVQFLIGAGFIVQAAPELDVLVELNFATKAYKDSDHDINLPDHDINLPDHDINLSDHDINLSHNDIGLSDNDLELTGGVQYNFDRDLVGRAGIGVGLEDGAPRLELILGASAFF